MEHFARTKEGIIALYQELSEEVIAFVKDNQGDKGYINTQERNEKDIIYAVRYDWSLMETTEDIVCGVRVVYDCLEVALSPKSKTERWNDDDFKTAHWYSVSERSSDTYFRITLDNIADIVGEYVG